MVENERIDYHFQMKSEQPILIENGLGLDESGLVHRVWEPDGDGPHKTIVMLQGRSGNEDVTWVFGRTLPKEWLVVSPRALYEDRRGGYSWDLKPSGDWPAMVDFEPAVAAVKRFIAALPSLYNADLSQLYLLGFSQGAAVSYSYTLQDDTRVQGIAGLVGLIATDAEESPHLTKLRDLPILMAVGRTDDTVPHAISHSCANALIHGGARLDYREYDTGHKLNSKGMRDLTQWWQQFVG